MLEGAVPLGILCHETRDNTMPKKIAPITISQIEEALEERQSSGDRRRSNAGLPGEVKEERRKKDRRSKKPETEH
jgi:hypothetical protein